MFGLGALSLVLIAPQLEIKVLSKDLAGDTRLHGLKPEERWSVTTLAGNGEKGLQDGVGLHVKFVGPFGMCYGVGGLYVADTFNNCIRKVSQNGVTMLHAGARSRTAPRDGHAIKNAGFHAPHGVSQDALGNVYVADTMNHLIRKISTSGKVTTFAGGGGEEGSQKKGYRDGPSLSALFDAPYDLCVVDDIVYVSDAKNYCVRRIKDGKVYSLAGGHFPGFRDKRVADGRDGYGTHATFHGPRGITANRQAIYVCDIPIWVDSKENTAHVIRRISPNGEVSRAAGGDVGFEDGKRFAAKFNMPNGIAVGPSGHVYISDTLNYKIRRLSPRGRVVTLMGLQGYASWADGVGIEAHFRGPHTLALNPRAKEVSHS